MSGETSFKKILVAYEGSPDSAKAIKAAAAVAKMFGASVRVLHVYSVPLYTYVGPSGMPPIDANILEDAARSKARSTIESGVDMARKEGLKAQGELLEGGSVVQAIVEFAQGEKVDLIVIGTRGMSGFKKLLLGSVSSGVVTDASCPVLVVK